MSASAGRDSSSLIQAGAERADRSAGDQGLVGADRVWRSQDCLKYDRASPVIKPQFVVEKLYEVTGGDAYVTSDVGQHQMWAAQYYKFNKPRRWINSGGLGTMGFGLPAAMGVQLAHPDAMVACITGEGSIQMNIQELATCTRNKVTDQGHPAQQRLSRHGAPVAGVLLRRTLCRVLHDLPARFREAGRSLWACGHAHREARRCRTGLAEAFGKYKDRLVFLNFLTDPRENVYPMIPAGKGLSEMILI
jgi:acetolactate synthase I/II/III large subunit